MPEKMFPGKAVYIYMGIYFYTFLSQRHTKNVCIHKGMQTQDSFIISYFIFKGNEKKLKIDMRRMFELMWN